jgi:glyoxylase-like metal-dependent hydrolase (beta-lactamase superfamily II)/rhodanese-related sulfurtransferase
VVLHQFYLGCLAHASYLVGDEHTGAAAVIDPRRDVDEYLTFARERGLTISHAVLTHFHADFVAGHLELRDRAGAAIYLGRAARAEFPFTPLGDGDVIALGRVRLEALETPGHTPEAISLLVFDLDRDAATPHAVLTGDTLFVGDVGRPDLMAAPGWAAADLGGMLYDSLHRKLLPLDDGTLVYPAHGAGSLCGKALGPETFSTMGVQRRDNYALQPMGRDAFVALVTADQPAAPPYFGYDAELNSRERETLDAALARELRPLDVEAMLAARDAGAQVLDTRDAPAFAAAHVRGSLNVGLGGQYATWAGTVLTTGRPLVLVTEPGAERESALRLGRIGFDNVTGFLAGGLGARDARPDLVESTERLGPAVLDARLRGAAPPLVVDVRTAGERAAGAIPGSVHLPLGALVARLGELPRDRPLVLTCAGGFRSSIASSLLRREGLTDVAELAGGTAAWVAAGLPTGAPA